jgi:hypothetical protein
MKMMRRFSYAAALLLVIGAAVRIASNAQAARAELPRELHAVSPQSGANACKLPVSDQVKAVNAFAKMVPVFRHPRCFNCHGNFNVADPNEHSGAAVVPKGMNIREVMTVENRIRFHAQCAECHNRIEGRANRPTAQGDRFVSGWMMAPEPMQWVTAKDNESLCMLVKRHEENADSFVSHVRIDHGEIQFLKAAFEGKRALDSAAIETYDVVTEKPPGSMSSLIADATRWARLVGDHWKDSQDCGCVKPKVELVMRSQIIAKAQGQAITAEFSGSVMLEADTASVYSGSAPMTIGKISMPIPPQCTMVSSPKGGKLIVKDLRFGDGGNSGISLLVFPENSTGSHTFNCPGLPRPLEMPLFPPAQMWRYAHGGDLRGNDYFIDGFQVQSQSANGRSMVARKETTRTISQQGGETTAKTVFEIWTVPPAPR